MDQDWTLEIPDIGNNAVFFRFAGHQDRALRPALQGKLKGSAGLMGFLAASETLHVPLHW